MKCSRCDKKAKWTDLNIHLCINCLKTAKITMQLDQYGRRNHYYEWDLSIAVIDDSKTKTPSKHRSV